jgi:O-antigen/teichoic acid export membrane protein
MSGSRLAGQALHSTVVFGLSFLSRLGLTIALGKSLSPSDYGVYSLITAVVAISTGLLPLGAPHYVVREVPGAAPDEGASIFKSVAGVQVMVVMAVLALGLTLGGPGLGHLLGLDRHPHLLVMIGLLVFADSLAGDLARFLFARQLIEQGNLVLFMQSGLWAYGVFAVYASVGLTFEILLAVWAVSLAIAIVYGAWRAEPARLWRAPFEPRRYLSAVAFGFPLLSAYILVGADWFTRFYLASVHSTAVMGLYAYPQSIILMIAAVSAPLIASPLEPYVIAAFRSGQPHRSGYLLGIGLRYRLLLVVPLLIVAVVCSDSLFRLMARSEYASTRSVLALLAPVPVLVILANTFERALFLERRTRMISRCQIGAAIVQALLCLVLVPWQPFYGAALALDGAYVTLVALLWRQYRRSTVPIELALVRTAFAAIPCAVTVWAVAHVLAFLPPLPLLVLVTVVAGGTYLVLAYVFRVLSAAEARRLRTLAAGGGRRVLVTLAGK